VRLVSGDRQDPTADAALGARVIATVGVGSGVFGVAVSSQTGDANVTVGNADAVAVIAG